MPNGYTAALFDAEQSREDFLLRCARAFGPLFHQRDDPMDDKPRLRTVDTTYAETALAEAQQRLSAAEGWSDDEAEAEALAHNDEQEDRWQCSQESANELRARCESLIAQVEAWEPPTDDHVALKDFTLAQLQECIDHECVNYAKPEPIRGAEFRAHLIELAQRDIERHSESITLAHEWAKAANKWIGELCDSLGVTLSAKNSGSAPTTPGGRAQKFAASMRVERRGTRDEVEQPDVVVKVERETR